MKLIVTVPELKKILFGGIKLKMAKNAGEKWIKSQLGDYANKSGVYIFYSKGKILYIGKTTGPKNDIKTPKIKWGNFGERLRRHLQITSSQNSRVHQHLVKHISSLYCYFIELDDIDDMIRYRVNGKELSKIKKALILEQVLIGAFDSNILVNK